MWFTLESCAFDFYNDQARKVAQARNALVISGRAPQPAYYKLSFGASLFFALLAVILAPAYIFSSLNSFLEDNPVRMGAGVG